MYENKPITGSHVVDLVNDMLRHRKGFEPVGWSVFARGLARMNVPENIVRNPQRQSAIREFKARVRGGDSRQSFPLATYSTFYLIPSEKAKAESSKPAPSSCSLVTIMNHENRHFIIVNSFLYFDHSIKYV